MTFCPICYKQTEKEIWKRENNCKEIRWIFCPNHGYIRDNEERTALSFKVLAAKKRRKRSQAMKRSPAPNNKQVFLISRGLISLALLLIVSLSAVFGYFVGIHADSIDSILRNLHMEGSTFLSPGEQQDNALVQRDLTRPCTYERDSEHILPR